MNELKKQYELLLRALVKEALGNSFDLQQLQGTAIYDNQKDSFIKSLAEFANVEKCIRGLAPIQAHYGVEQASRIALQLVYEYFAVRDAIGFDAALLENIWSNFVTELDTPVWRSRCVSNLRHFQCDELSVDLGDGVSIHGRNPDMLNALGFHRDIWSRLVADWSRSGASSFVLIAESTVIKKPENFISMDNGQLWLRCLRAIGAMRLVAEGDVGISAIFLQRVARFNVGIGGLQSMGATIDTMGSSYALLSEHRRAFDSTYAALARLEHIGYGKAPGNLDLALRAFMSTYDRYPTAADTKLIDSITALEAILGTETEIAFKLAFRVASLLASNDQERAALLGKVKGFYDVRSRVVHGGRLKEKQNEYLSSVDDLREIVRRVLNAFVVYASDSSETVPANSFKKDLDAILVDAVQREKIRKVLGLDQPTHRNVKSESTIRSLILQKK